MSYSFPPYFGAGYFYSTTVTDYTFISNPFIFTAVAFLVLCWAEDLFTEQTIPFRFQGSVINCFRFFYFPPGPIPDLIRRCNAYSHRGKIVDIIQRASPSLLFVFNRDLLSRHHWNHPPGLIPYQFLVSWQFSISSSSTIINLFIFFRKILTSRPRLCSSLINTLKDSGTPGSGIFSPLTIAS